MKNKKLLSSILAAATLLGTTISVNNKVVNAAVSYKDKDRQNLSNLEYLVYAINCNRDEINTIEIQELYDAYNQLVRSVKRIFQYRPKNVKSKLRDSMIENGVVESIDKYEQINEFDYKNKNRNEIRSDLYLMQKSLKKFDKIEGGWFTVWDSNVKDSVNILKNKVASLINRLENKNKEFFNGLDGCFEKLGGTQEDINQYKRAKSVKYKSELAIKPKTVNGNRIMPDIDKKRFGKYAKDMKKINLDAYFRSWANEPNHEVKAKKANMLGDILKIHSFENKDKSQNDDGEEFYDQGYSSMCQTIIDKFIDRNNNDINIETEAKIYYIYKTIFDRLKIKEYSNIIFSCDLNDEVKFEYFKKYLKKFVQNHQDLQLPEYLNAKQNFMLLALSIPTLFDTLDKNLVIYLLDKIVYENLEGDKAIQLFADELYKAVINNDKELTSINSRDYGTLMVIHLREKARLIPLK